MRTKWIQWKIMSHKRHFIPSTQVSSQAFTESRPDALWGVVVQEIEGEDAGSISGSYRCAWARHLTVKRFRQPYRWHFAVCVWMFVWLGEKHQKMIIIYIYIYIYILYKWCIESLILVFPMHCWRIHIYFITLATFCSKLPFINGWISNGIRT